MQKNFQTIIAMLITTVLIFVLYNINVVDQEIQENQYNKLVNDLSIVTNNFELWINEKKIIIDTAKDVINNFKFHEIIKYKTKNPYLNINNEKGDVSQVYIGLSNGDFVTGGGWVPPEDYDPRTRTWYKEAKDSNETIVSKVYIDRETGNKLVTVSSPLWIDDEFVGVVSVDVFLESISDFLKTQIREENNYAFLIDYDGTVVMHTMRKSLISKNLYTDVREASIIAYFELAKQGYGLVRMEYEYDHQNIRGIIQKVAGRDWYMGVALVNENSFLNSWEVEKRHLLINGLSILIIFVLLSILLKNRSELNQLHDYLTQENERDFLTGIYNRRYLNVYLENLWKNRNCYRSISMLMIDVDLFKHYNDTYGHLLGDDVLKKITTSICENVRSDDVFARFGGEEFALVLLNVPDEEIIKISEKIKNSIYNLDIVHRTSPYERVTVSIGVTSVNYNDHGDVGIRNAIEHADIALYKAKEHGRNKVVVYEQSDNKENTI